MIEFFKSNSLILVAIILITVFLVLFFVIKYSKSKSASVTRVFEKEKSADASDASKEPEEQSEEEKQEEPEDESETKEGEDKNGEDEDSSEDEADKQKDKKEKVKKTKSVEKVFKSEEEPAGEVKVEVPESTSSISEEELLTKMEFVKSSKRVSKLVKHSPIEPEQEMITDELVEVEPTIMQTAEPPVSKHFNRTRRLSKFIEQNNFDEMFDSHISDKYLNIDVSRHLDVTDEKTNKLYERASKTVANSDVRLIYGGDENGSNLRRDKKLEESFVEKRKREIFAEMIESKDKIEEDIPELIIHEDSLDDDIKLDSKTILVADAVLKRRGKKKK